LNRVEAPVPKALAATGPRGVAAHDRVGCGADHDVREGWRHRRKRIVRTNDGAVRGATAALGRSGARRAATRTQSSDLGDKRTPSSSFRASQIYRNPERFQKCGRRTRRSRIGPRAISTSDPGQTWQKEIGLSAWRALADERRSHRSGHCRVRKALQNLVYSPNFR
jgi:hypothetical protein